MCVHRKGLCGVGIVKIHLLTESLACRTESDAYATDGGNALLCSSGCFWRRSLPAPVQRTLEEEAGSLIRQAAPPSAGLTGTNTLHPPRTARSAASLLDWSEIQELVASGLWEQLEPYVLPGAHARSFSR